MTRILLTGSTGFVGSALLKHLRGLAGYDVLATHRPQGRGFMEGGGLAPMDLCSKTGWGEILVGVDVVIHTAGRAHVLNDTAKDPLAEYRRVNVSGTLNLAGQAAMAGVRRFLFISSIKVNGDGTVPGKPYTPDDVPMPVDPYGVSKLEAEDGLLRISESTGMEVVIIRPPLIYGPGVKANFLTMMNWVNKGVPMPFGAIGNKRSLVALDNLVDLVVTCTDHPAASNQIFLASDGDDLSTTELLRRMAAALGRSARLLPVPCRVLGAAAGVVGKRALWQRLCGSLQVDITKTRNLLSWTPQVGVDEALRRTARHFLEVSAS